MKSLNPLKIMPWKTNEIVRSLIRLLEVIIDFNTLFLIYGNSSIFNNTVSRLGRFDKLKMQSRNWVVVVARPRTLEYMDVPHSL
jgi:hypothetical protein